MTTTRTTLRTERRRTQRRARIRHALTALAVGTAIGIGIAALTMTGATGSPARQQAPGPPIQLQVFQASPGIDVTTLPAASYSARTSEEIAAIQYERQVETIRSAVAAGEAFTAADLPAARGEAVAALG